MDVEFWWRVRWSGWGLVILSIALSKFIPREAMALIDGIGVFLVAFGHYKEKEYERG